MSGPRITVRCDCGAVRYLGYGEAWTCESCGRRWNTGQIPREEYERVAQEIARYRRFAIGGIAIAAAVLVPLGVLVNFMFLLFVPALLALWAGIVSPHLKRRLWRRIGTLPSWQLRPE
jgi:hypothetical protein